MEKQQYIDRAEQALYKVYNRFPVVFDRGEGICLYDTDGKEYLDFGAGIAVMGLGYNCREFNEALKVQMDKLCHTSNLFYNVPSIEAGEKLLKASGMEKVFFTNSGAEAIEGALKAARKYAWKKGTGRYEFIAMEHSFHGRSIGAVSVTGSEAYRTPFEPLLPGVKFAEFNNLDSVKAQLTDKTCGIILEALQGEGGINRGTQEFMEGIRKLCDQEGILMICDEIQCGMGRTGEMFAWQSYGTKPDIMAMAKAIGSGLPVGAFAMTEAVAEYSLEPGDHGTTYGGNPLACAAVAKTVEIFEREEIVSHVRETGAYLTERLGKLAAETDEILDCRGIGLIQGMKMKRPVGEIIHAALEKGLLVISARDNVLRLLPPLIIEKEHIDEMIEKLKSVL